MKRFILILLLLTGFSPAAGATANHSPARASLETSISQIISILNEPGLKDPAQRDDLLLRAEKIIYAAFDFEEFSARTVGVKWNSFTGEQKTNFQDAFAALLHQTYITRLEEYAGQAISFVSEKSSTAGDKVEILTTVPFNNATVPISYRMLEKNGHWKVYDVIIENLSLVQNYRNQFQEVLGKQPPDALVELIHRKTQELLAGNVKKQ